MLEKRLSCYLFFEQCLLRPVATYLIWILHLFWCWLLLTISTAEKRKEPIIMFTENYTHRMLDGKTTLMIYYKAMVFLLLVGGRRSVGWLAAGCWLEWIYQCASIAAVETSFTRQKLVYQP